MKLRRLGDGREFEIELLSHNGPSLRLRIDGAELEAELNEQTDGSAIVTFAGRRIRIFGARRRDVFVVAAGPASFEFKPVETVATARLGLVSPELTSPMPGKVLKIMTSEGARVEAGDPLIVLESMKMETLLSAEAAALIRRIHVAEGAMVQGGALLIEFSPIGD